MKKSISSIAGATLIALILATAAAAIPITGSIAFSGAPNFNVSPISAATSILSYDSARVAPGQQTGVFSAVVDLLPVTFSPFTFSPPTQAINPLWTFTYLGVTYSFRTTSQVAVYNAPLNIWNMGGSGVLQVTGYDDTLAQWNYSAGQVGASFYFGSAAAAVATPRTVPDSAATILLIGLGLGFIALAGTGRRGNLAG